MADLSAGRLELVAIPTLAIDLVTPLVARFRAAHPGVQVRIREPAPEEEVFEVVLQGRAELGLCTLPVPGAGLVVIPVEEQELVVVLPPGAPGDAGPVRLEDLADYPLISAPRGTPTARQLEEALAAAGVAWDPAVETDHRDSIVPLVAAGAGAAVVPRGLAEAVVGAGGRRAVVRPFSPPVLRQVALLHRDRGLGPAAAAFTQVLRRE